MPASLLLVLLFACGAEPAEKADVTTQALIAPGVWRMVDHEAGVVCWRLSYNDGGGISCLPCFDTNGRGEVCYAR